MARTLINVPPKAKRGEVIEIKTLISHDMETGYRPDNVGRMIPRDIISLFVASYNGQEIFRLACRIRVFRVFVLHGRDGERHTRGQVDRRQRLLGHRVRSDHS